MLDQICICEMQQNTIKIYLGKLVRSISKHVKYCFIEILSRSSI
jgi:hypothetical protein